jgi:hypothetical protein
MQTNVTTILKMAVIIAVETNGLWLSMQSAYDFIGYSGKTAVWKIGYNWSLV